MAVRGQQAFQGRNGARMIGLGGKLCRPANGHHSQRKNCTMQDFPQVPRAFHFNADGRRFQEERDGPAGRLKSARKPDTGEGNGVVHGIILPFCCQTSGY